MARHIAAEPPPLHLRRPHLPEAAASVVARAMHKNPQERFPSAPDLCAAFDAAAAEAREGVRYLRPRPAETDVAGARHRTRKMAAVKAAGRDGAEANQRA